MTLGAGQVVAKLLQRVKVGPSQAACVPVDRPFLSASAFKKHITACLIVQAVLWGISLAGAHQAGKLRVTNVSSGETVNGDGGVTRRISSG